MKASLPSTCGIWKRRSGWGLLQAVGGMFAGALVLSVCVPLFITGQRHADLGSARAKMMLLAREISSHFREDVRQSSEVRVSADGRSLQLVHVDPVRPDVRTAISYQSTPTGLLREVRPSLHGLPAERAVYGALLTGTRFGRTGQAVTARLDLSHTGYGRTLRYRLDCEATPRSSL